MNNENDLNIEEIETEAHPTPAIRTTGSDTDSKETTAGSNSDKQKVIAETKQQLNVAMTCGFQNDLNIEEIETEACPTPAIRTTGSDTDSKEPTAGSNSDKQNVIAETKQQLNVAMTCGFQNDLNIEEIETEACPTPAIKTTGSDTDSKEPTAGSNSDKQNVIAETKQQLNVAMTCGFQNDLNIEEIETEACPTPAIKTTGSDTDSKEPTAWSNSDKQKVGGLLEDLKPDTESKHENLQYKLLVQEIEDLKASLLHYKTLNRENGEKVVQLEANLEQFKREREWAAEEMALAQETVNAKIQDIQSLYREIGRLRAIIDLQVQSKNAGNSEETDSTKAVCNNKRVACEWNAAKRECKELQRLAGALETRVKNLEPESKLWNKQTMNTS